MEENQGQRESRVWLICDIPQEISEYPKLNEWLRAHNAQDCGKKAYTFFYTFNMERVAKDLLREEFSNMNLGEDVRLYAIFQKEDDAFVGTFLKGERNNNL